MLTKFSPGNWLGVNQSTCRGCGSSSMYNRARSLKYPSTFKPYPTHFGSQQSLTKNTAPRIHPKIRRMLQRFVLVSERWLHQGLRKISRSRRSREKVVLQGRGVPNSWLTLCTNACYKPFSVHVIIFLKLPPDSTRILNLKLLIKCHFSSRSEALICIYKRKYLTGLGFQGTLLY